MHGKLVTCFSVKNKLALAPRLIDLSPEVFYLEEI